MTYYLYIKSHCEAPDWEQEIEAQSDGKAIDAFYALAKGEFDKEYIKANMVNDLTSYNDSLYNDISVDFEQERYLKLSKEENNI